MTDLATLQQDLDDLRAARRNGLKTATFTAGGSSRSVTYRDDAEMRAAIAACEAEIAAMQGTATPKPIIVHSTKGW